MRRIVVAGVLLLLLAGGVSAWLLGRPAYQRHKERQWLRLAETSLQRGEYQAAARGVQEVLKINPRNVAACKVNVRLAEISNSPELLGWRQRLVELEPTLANRLALASSLLRVEAPPFPMTTRLLEDLRTSATNQAGFHVVSAERALRLGTIPEAESHLEEAMRLEPGNKTHPLNLAVLRFQSADKGVAEKARADLQALADEPSVSLKALRSLLADALRRDDGAAALEMSQKILANTNAVFSDRVQHMSALYAARSSDLKPYQSSLEQTAGTNLAHVAELAAWWNGRGFATNTIRLLKALPPPIRKQPPVPMLLADAYMLEKDWRTLQKWLRSENWNEQEFLRLAVLARAARARGDEDLAVVDWNRAVQSASDRMLAVSSLLTTAHSWGWTNEVERLLWQAAEKYQNESWPLVNLEKRYLADGNSRGLFNVYAARLARQPTNALTKNDLAAVSLLLNTDLKQAHALARDAFTQTPTSPAVISTYAFSLYLQGKVQEGLDVMNQIPEDQREHPSIAVYYALLLAAAGDTEEAAKYRALAARGLLLPEERLLLARQPVPR